MLIPTMSRAQNYCDRAQQLRDGAARVMSLDDRKSLEDLADKYERLAIVVERGSKIE